MTTGTLMNRTGRYRELIWTGMTLLTLGNGLFVYFNATSTITEIIIFEIIKGIGACLLFEPPLIALQALASQDDTATATATLGVFRHLAMSFSTVIGGVVFQDGMQLQIPGLRIAGLPTDVVQQLSGGDAGARVMIVETISDPAQRLAVKEAFAFSLRNSWVLYTYVSTVGLLVSGFIAKKALSEEHTETKTGL